MRSEQPVGSEERWVLVGACPACGDPDGSRYRALNIREYRFADEVVRLPQGGVKLVWCRVCGLLYKDVVPSPEFLAGVFTRQAGKAWADDYGFADEVAVIHGLMGDGPFDVLDIGASNGGLLKALALGGGRRSALDVVMHPGLDGWVRGEFIRGLADSDELSWSEDPYDVVTMFDVAEHLYDPDQAFANLRRLAKPDGFVVVETGDAGSYRPRAFGAQHWEYTHLFEHHVFWSRRSFENTAQRHGMRVVDFLRKRHKMSLGMSVRENLMQAAKFGLGKLTPAGYLKLAKATGRPGNPPVMPLVRDHFRAVLQRSALVKEPRGGEAR